MLPDALLRPDSFFRKRAPRPSLGGAFAVVLVISVVTTIALGAVGGGEGSFGNTVSITAWGMLPSLFQTTAGFGLLYLTLRNAEFGGSPEAVAEQVRLLVSKIRGVASSCPPSPRSGTGTSERTA